MITVIIDGNEEHLFRVQSDFDLLRFKPMNSPVRSYGMRQPKATPAAVAHAADALFQIGTPPTVRNVRDQLGGGALSTITPLLRAWWKALPSRLDRAPKTRDQCGEVAHLVEALWLQAIEEAKIRAASTAASGAAASRRERQALEAHRGVAPLSDTARVIARLEQDLNEFKRLWREERASRRSADRQADQLRAEVLRLVRATVASHAPGRSTPGHSAIRAATKRKRAPSYTQAKAHKVALRKRKPTAVPT